MRGETALELRHEYANVLELQYLARLGWARRPAHRSRAAPSSDSLGLEKLGAGVRRMDPGAPRTARLRTCGGCAALSSKWRTRSCAPPPPRQASLLSSALKRLEVTFEASLDDLQLPALIGRTLLAIELLESVGVATVVEVKTGYVPPSDSDDDEREDGDDRLAIGPPRVLSSFLCRAAGQRLALRSKSGRA